MFTYVDWTIPLKQHEQSENVKQPQIVIPSLPCQRCTVCLCLIREEDKSSTVDSYQAGQTSADCINASRKPALIIGFCICNRRSHVKSCSWYKPTPNNQAALPASAHEHIIKVMCLWALWGGSPFARSPPEGAEARIHNSTSGHLRDWDCCLMAAGNTGWSSALCAARVLLQDW